MCKSAIEIELEKIFMEQNCFETEYILMLKEKFTSNNKRIKRLILASFMNHISKNKSLALFDEDIFNIYKTIIDNYIIFLSQEESLKFKFNDEMLKNLAGITSVLKSQVRFFFDDKNVDVNPIYAEKKAITTKYIDNIYKKIDSLCSYNFKNINIKNIKQFFIENAIKEIERSYKTNLLECFNAINDIENRKEVSYFNDVLEEEREILSSIIKLQIKALEDLCKNDEEKNQIEILLKPIIEVYQQTGKSFEELNLKIKMVDTNINLKIDIDNKEMEKAIFNIFKDIKEPEEQFKQKAFNIFEQYLSDFKYNIILQQQQKVDNIKDNIEKTLALSKNVTNMFESILKYVNKNKKFYEKNDLYNIIDGINETINIKIDNIKEKENEIFSNKDVIYKNINDTLKDFKNIELDYDFDNIYVTLKEQFDLEKIQQFININSFLSKIEKTFKPYIKKLDDFIKNTILFEISTFQEIIYYSVVRLRESDDEKILDFTKYIDNIEVEIEKCLINNNILPIKPNPHDMFNAKEHEVLLAEKNEDFVKGQIIKVINYGYKKKDEGVIKRATIIAAK